MCSFQKGHHNGNYPELVVLAIYQETARVRGTQGRKKKNGIEKIGFETRAYVCGRCAFPTTEESTFTLEKDELCVLMKRDKGLRKDCFFFFIE